MIGYSCLSKTIVMHVSKLSKNNLMKTCFLISGG